MPNIIHPYADFNKGHWLRGNLHTHTTRSDGRLSLQQIIDDYASRNYHYLMISDHDTLATAEHYAEIDNKNLLLIPGNEISAHGPHLLHVNPDRKIAPASDRQIVIDQVNQSQGFIIANHPNWQAEFNHCSIENLAQWHGYRGLEIYNGVIGRLQGSPYATNKWDQLLSVGRRIWGYANDDCHWAENDIELGWNMTCVDQPTVENVITALQAGRFYPSTGVTITGINVNNSTITIQTEDARKILAIYDGGSRFAETNDSAIEVDVPEDATYVRFECWGAGEQFAWTQPFFINPD